MCECEMVLLGRNGKFGIFLFGGDGKKPTPHIYIEQHRPKGYCSTTKLVQQRDVKDTFFDGVF